MVLDVCNVEMSRELFELISACCMNCVGFCYVLIVMYVDIC